MKKLKGALLIGSVLLGLILVGCSKKTTKENTTKPNPTTNNTTTTPVEKLTVSFKSNGGSNVDSQSVTKGGHVSKPNNPTKDGYTFKGWFYNGEEWNFNENNVTSDITLEAQWDINSWAMTLINDIIDAGTISGDGTYQYNEVVALGAIAATGYTFDGWYDGEERISDHSIYGFAMPDKDLEYTAKWNPIKYTLRLDNDADDVTITGAKNGYKYDYRSTITLTANDVPEGYLIQWENGSTNEIFVGNEYSFTMPASSIEIKVKFVDPYVRKDNKIYFGYYPQTLEKDETTTESLNELVGTPINAKEGYNWVSYRYYRKSSIADYMWYIDLDLNNDGRNDYRGVYYSEYRPFNYSTEAEYDTENSWSNTYIDDNGYRLETVYWFKYEAIEWLILKEEEGKAFLAANLLLDTQDFHPYNQTKSFNHNGGNGYASNYALSDIRKWLNSTFYETAFMKYEEKIIQLTLVDNSAATTNGSSDICDNTNDKVFLLSYQEIMTLFANNEARRGVATDYALSQGVTTSDGYSRWFLRSPSSGSTDFAGNVAYSGEYGSFFVCRVDVGGVRPALVIEL